MLQTALPALCVLELAELQLLVLAQLQQQVAVHVQAQVQLLVLVQAAQTQVQVQVWPWQLVLLACKQLLEQALAQLEETVAVLLAHVRLALVRVQAACLLQALLLALLLLCFVRCSRSSHGPRCAVHAVAWSPAHRHEQVQLTQAKHLQPQMALRWPHLAHG